MSVDYKSKELNLYCNDGGLLKISDATSLRSSIAINLASSAQLMQLDFKSPSSGSLGGHYFFIPSLYVTWGAVAYHAGQTFDSYNTRLNTGATNLTAEAKTRGDADTLLTNNLNAEIKARGDADATHTANIAQEVYDRGAGDLANLALINNEVADRKAAITVVSAASSANALAITAEQKRAEEKEALLDTAVADEKKRAEAKEALLDTADSDEKKRALAAELVLTNDLSAENKRATEKEAKLDARIDFITSNVDPVAIDSLSEIVAQFSTNGQGYAQRLTWLEGVVASLVNKSQ
jgi:hypothetical protein